MTTRLLYDDYYFRGSGRWLRLRCETLEQPDDRWISIAESFELLPDEEEVALGSCMKLA